MKETLVSQEYLEHFTKTPSMYSSCTNNEHHPETTRALAGWGDIQANTISFTVVTDFSKHFIDLAQPGKRISLVSVTLNDYLTYQYKGKVISSQASSAEDLKKVETYVDGFCALVPHVGIDPIRYRVGFAQAPYTTITFELDAVFDQTPRVGAGALLQSKSQ